MANQMVEETTQNPPQEGDDMDKGAWYSFHVFPVADAHALVRFNCVHGYSASSRALRLAAARSVHCS